MDEPNATLTSSIDDDSQLSKLMFSGNKINHHSLSMHASYTFSKQKGQTAAGLKSDTEYSAT